MPALIADERRERVAVQSDQPAAGKPWGPAGDVEKIVETVILLPVIRSGKRSRE